MSQDSHGWVLTPDDLDAMVEELLDSPWIGVDTEFIRESTFFPKIALIQVSSPRGIWLVDPLEFTPEEMRPFLDRLEDPKQLKVLHAAYADQECFYWTYGVVASPVFDTAVGAALCGIGDNAGLGKLTKELLGVVVPKGRARVRWLDRPLSRELENYAAQDVAYLGELYDVLRKKLESLGRWEWALESSAIDADEFELTAHEMAWRMAKSSQIDGRTFLILRSLLAWREERARRADLPRQWVAENELLLALSRSQPKSISDLKSFRGLSPKEVDKRGHEILDAIADGRAEDPNSVQLPQRVQGAMEGEEHGVALVKAFLSYLSVKHSIASRFLIPAAQIPVLLRSSLPTAREWADAGWIQNHAVDLVGRELEDLLNGKLALLLRGGKVEAKPLA